MSKVAIQGNASGDANTFTIAAPAGTASHTLTLPDETGTVLTTTSGVTTSGATFTGQVAVQTADASGQTPSTDADELVLENNGNAGMTLITSDGGTGSIRFNSATGSDYANIRANYGDNELRLSQNNSSGFVRFDTNGSERMRIKSNGYLNCLGVYAQTSGDSANVVVDASGDVKRATSALKYKQDVRDIESIDISSFRPVRYKSNIESDDQTIDHFGFIADEFHDAGLTELVSYGAIDEETGIAEVEGFRYDRMTAVLTKALQEAIARIETLEAEVATLKGASA